MKKEFEGYSLFIFDMDNKVLTVTKSGDKFRRSPDDWGFISGRLELLQDLKQAGKKIAVASNQAGVAYGYADPRQWIKTLYAFKEAGDFDAVKCSFNHILGTVEKFRKDDGRRLPQGGMLEEILKNLEIEREHTLMVGSTEEYYLAAKLTGMAFSWASDFFAALPTPTQEEESFDPECPF